MIYTIEEIKNTAIPIVEEYGVVRLSIFGSYARGEANDDSDLDFLIDKGDLRGLIQYYSFHHYHFPLNQKFLLIDKLFLQ